MLSWLVPVSVECCQTVNNPVGRQYDSQEFLSLPGHKWAVTITSMGARWSGSRMAESRAGWCDMGQPAPLIKGVRAVTAGIFVVENFLLKSCLPV